MQPDSITIPVDILNNGTTTDKVMTRYEEHLNRSVYIGPNHTPGARDMLGFYRTTPKVNGNFRGVQKTSLKFTQDVTVDGVDGVSQITSPQIIEVNFSFPVGATTADEVEQRQAVLALLDMDTIMNNLCQVLMI